MTKLRSLCDVLVSNGISVSSMLRTSIFYLDKYKRGYLRAKLVNIAKYLPAGPSHPLSTSVQPACARGH